MAEVEDLVGTGRRAISDPAFADGEGGGVAEPKLKGAYCCRSRLSKPSGGRSCS